MIVESINPRAYTIVELVDRSHVQTCKRAKADEIIVSSELSSMLIAQATLNHGITIVISDILSGEYGNQLYKISVPKTQVGFHFIDIFIYMKQTYHSTVIGVQKGNEGEVISNPPTSYQIEDTDYLIIIASAKP